MVVIDRLACRALIVDINIPHNRTLVKTEKVNKTSRLGYCVVEYELGHLCVDNHDCERSDDHKLRLKSVEVLVKQLDKWPDSVISTPAVKGTGALTISTIDPITTLQ